MNYWNACIQEPNSWLRWIECHPGGAAYLQAILSGLAIAVAIYVPWQIYRKQALVEAAIKSEYRNILIGALENLASQTKELVAVFDAAEGDSPDYVGDRIIETLDAMKTAMAVLRELEEIKRLDSFGAVRAIFNLRHSIRAVLPEMEREAAILENHWTPEAVSDSITALWSDTKEFHDRIADALHALHGNHVDFASYDELMRRRARENAYEKYRRSTSESE